MHYGGMWLDSDAIVLNDLNWLFEYLKTYEFVGFNNAGRLQPDPPLVRINCFLSRPNGRIIREWVRLQHLKFPKTTFDWNEIGAGLLTPICLENKQFVNILPFERICPIPSGEVETFTSKDDARAEQILEECFIVMLSNRMLHIRNSPLQQLTVDQIAAGDYLLAKILRKAVASIHDRRPRLSFVHTRDG